MDYTPVEGLPPMPEFGVMLRMSADCDQLRWYGDGPEECYADRRHGARLGVWHKSVRDLPAYLKPQECGNHTGVRWAEVTDFRGHGLRFTGDEMFFSALAHTPHELENALHADELPPPQYTVVRASLMQMGVGGDDSWGALTHEEYLIDVSRRLSFTFSFYCSIRLSFIFGFHSLVRLSFIFGFHSCICLSIIFGFCSGIRLSFVFGLYIRIRRKTFIRGLGNLRWDFFFKGIFDICVALCHLYIL